MNSNKSKTALVLAGGGLTGAVYEIGTLRAIDDLLVNLNVNEFDIYIGTSAGALVSAFLANGISPEEMLSIIDGSSSEIDAIQRQHIFRWNTSGIANWSINLPIDFIKSWSNYLFHFTDMSLFDFFWLMSDTFPAGLYDGLGLERYIRNTMVRLSRSNNFDELERELYIVATELDTGERAIFGPKSDVSISEAVAASSALPFLYKPFQIDGKDYIDGGMRGVASIDLAIERGANLVVCINPLVPYDNTNVQNNDVKNPFRNKLKKKGIQTVAGQTIKIFSHAGLHYHVKQIRRAHPQVDIILIEPKADDYEMFFNNIMRYSARLLVAQHGFESVTYDLAKDYYTYKEILLRHGIEITRRLVIQELAEIEESNHDPLIIRRVLEARHIGCKQRNPKTPVCRLSKVLADLECLLEDRSLVVGS